MSDTKKQIEDWQNKLRLSFDEASKLQLYLLNTLENFYFRYLETTLSKDLKTQLLSNNTYGTMSIETNVQSIMGIKNPEVRPKLIAALKNYGKSEGVEVRYGLNVEFKKLNPENGELIIRSFIDWDFPNFSGNPDCSLKKEIVFKYNDLGVLRKNFALKLEEACEIFL